MAETTAPCRHSKHSRRDDPKMIGRWKLGKTIGKGSSGRVKIARHTRTGEYAAVKIVSKQALVTSRMSVTGISDQADKILLSIEREIVLMKLIEHPNILSLYDVWETSKELYLILEYVQNGELFDRLVAKGRLSVEEALQYFQQIISAVDYCHRFNIAHRDLKPENLLLDKDNNIKVADFGMAAWEGGVAMLETSCGSPHYASPEVVEGKAYRGYMSDIWSCGVILYALLVGRLPFDDENIRRLLEKVKKGKYVMPDDIPLGAQDLLARMLEKDVDKRITMKQILVHPWFTCCSPKPIRGRVLPPPNLDTTLRPVRHANEIDTDIFSNLRTLWHDAPEEQILQALLNDENTWEKAVYHLLLQYRARRLEDYDVEEEHPTTQIKLEAVATVLPEPNPTLAKEKNQQLISPTVWDSTGMTLKFMEGPPTVAPLRSGHPVGPRPPSALNPVDNTIKGPPPVHSVKLERPISEPPSITRSAACGGPQLSQITHSDLDIDNIQHSFAKPFHLTSTPATGIPKNEMTSSAVPKIAVSVVTLTDTPGYDDDRFADAEEDYTSSEGIPLRSSVVTAPSNDSHSRRSSPGVPITPNISGNTTFGLGISTNNAHQRLGPRAPIPPNLSSRLKDPKGFLHPTDVIGSGRSANAATIVNPPPVPANATSHSMSRRAASDKENIDIKASVRSRPRSGPAATSSMVPKSATLERRRTLGDRHVQIVLPGEESQLRKKQDVSDFSDTSSGFLSSLSVDKPTWFANLFKFKPASFNLFSVYDAHLTRDECERLLTKMGVSVVINNTGHLICRFDGVIDPSGVMESVKAVRFRIGVHGVIHSHSVAGFKTSVSMVQEKGALSSFKLLFNRLRRDWDLDAPKPILKTLKASDGISVRDTIP